MSEMRMEERVKISVALEKDEDDYPPADFESLWASSLGEGLYRVENIPFFAAGIALGDVISASPDQGLLRFQGVIQPSGHRTLRVIVYDKREVSAVRELLKKQGCDVEQSHIPGLISVYGTTHHDRWGLQRMVPAGAVPPAGHFRRAEAWSPLGSHW